MISMLMIASCFSVINAQLIVDDNGHVAVGIDTESTINSTLSVNGDGRTIIELGSTLNVK